MKYSPQNDRFHKTSGKCIHDPDGTAFLPGEKKLTCDGGEESGIEQQLNLFPGQFPGQIGCQKPDRGDQNEIE